MRRYLWIFLPVCAIAIWLACSSNSGSNNTPPPPPPKFHGAAYTVGAVQTVTTTQPEAEEVIAVDPSNPSNLAAAIIDFSLRNPGDGTIKFAISTNGGSSWSDAFVP